MRRVVLLALGLSALAAAPSAFAQTGTFTNSNATQLASNGPASPYPSQLNVGGMAGPIGKVTLSLGTFSLSSSLFDLMLVSPHGDAVMLTSDVLSAFTGATYTFDDAASGPMPTSSLGGILSFTPTNLGADSDDFPGGPSGPGGPHMSALNGQDANGTWKLYGYDRTPVTLDIGQIGSWTLNLTTLVGELGANPTSKDFGSASVGSASSPASFALSNAGNAPLTISSSSIQGPDASSFSLDSNSCTTTLDPTGGCALGVSFKPTSAGAKNAVLVLAGNALGSPLSIPLTGTGVAQTVTNGQTTLTGLTTVTIPTGGQSGGSNNSQTNPTGTTQPNSSEITVEQPTFSGGGAPAVGEPTLLGISARDPKQAVTGVIVNFGEKHGVFAESACVAGVNKGNQTNFNVPYEFLSSGSHTITLTVFAGGCGSPVSHTFSFTVDIPAAKTASYRVRAHAAATIGGPPITTACADGTLAPSTANATRVVTALLCIMNEQRKLAKLKPLKISKKLARAALAHSRAMIAGKFFAHQGPRELALVSRLQKVKYRGNGGENIGAGAGDLGTPLGMVDGWMHSSLHKTNLLSKRWKFVGIGFLAQFPISGEFPPVATYTTDFGNKR